MLSSLAQIVTKKRKTGDTSSAATAVSSWPKNTKLNLCTVVTQGGENDDDCNNGVDPKICFTENGQWLIAAAPISSKSVLVKAWNKNSIDQPCSMTMDLSKKSIATSTVEAGSLVVEQVGLTSNGEFLQVLLENSPSLVLISIDLDGENLLGDAIELAPPQDLLQKYSRTDLGLCTSTSEGNLATMLHGDGLPDMALMFDLESKECLGSFEVPHNASSTKSEWIRSGDTLLLHVVEQTSDMMIPPPSAKPKGRWLYVWEDGAPPLSSDSMVPIKIPNSKCKAVCRENPAGLIAVSKSKKAPASSGIQILKLHLDTYKATVAGQSFSNKLLDWGYVSRDIYWHPSGTHVLALNNELKFKDNNNIPDMDRFLTFPIDPATGKAPTPRKQRTKRSFHNNTIKDVVYQATTVAKRGGPFAKTGDFQMMAPSSSHDGSASEECVAYIDFDSGGDGGSHQGTVKHIKIQLFSSASK